jgi:hypothetical protein
MSLHRGSGISRRPRARKRTIPLAPPGLPWTRMGMGTKQKHVVKRETIRRAEDGLNRLSFVSPLHDNIGNCLRRLQQLSNRLRLDYISLNPILSAKLSSQVGIYRISHVLSVTYLTCPLNHNLVRLRLYLKFSKDRTGKDFVKPSATYHLLEHNRYAKVLLSLFLE